MRVQFCRLATRNFGRISLHPLHFDPMTVYLDAAKSRAQIGAER
jgi:hypothetical protein